MKESTNIEKRSNVIRTLSLLFVFSYAIVAGAVFGGQEEKINYSCANDLFSVSFPTGNEGWACGRWGVVLHTFDGGRNWLRQESSTDFTLSCICFVDTKYGWAVGDGGIIIKTTDGGITWTRQNGPDQENDADKLFYMGVYFANASEGWIVGERTHILHTKDGGETWEIQFSEEDFILKSISFCDEKHGWAVGEYGYIYHTNNGGETWEHQAGMFEYSDESSEIVGGNFLFDVTAVSPQVAWVVGIEGYIAKTEDGGVTWRQVASGVSKRHLFGVSADGKGGVLIVGKTELLVSKDGGDNFKHAKFDPPITYGWLYRITPRGEESYTAVGKQGRIYLSDSNGESWQSTENKRKN